ncbi:hypothetical protein JTE90_028955 [Oedothorax gibbosus]|uniref:Uncharacterized protein n=1 Tax=Oedothorax gibbosus TaxID=931172 RepID=A0AAV6VIM8_9ARAC|nr:hypothetical protein JTE90_028955 [Oedothorax gibbosus]
MFDNTNPLTTTREVWNKQVGKTSLENPDNFSARGSFPQTFSCRNQDTEEEASCHISGEVWRDLKHLGQQEAPQLTGLVTRDAP